MYKHTRFVQKVTHSYTNCVHELCTYWLKIMFRDKSEVSVYVSVMKPVIRALQLKCNITNNIAYYITNEMFVVRKFVKYQFPFCILTCTYMTHLWIDFSRLFWIANAHNSLTWQLFSTCVKFFFLDSIYAK